MGQVFSMGAHLRRFIAEKDPQHAAVLLEQSLTAIEKVKATMAKARELPQRTIGISAETAVEMAKGAEKPMQPSPGPGRGRKTSVNNTRFTDQRGSTNSSYLAARLKRDHPDIAARVANGEFKSIRAAALEAGIVKAVRHGDTRTIDLFAEPEARPVAAPPPPRPAVSTPAATGPATSLKQLPVKVITRKDGHTQTYHVAPEDESGSFGPVFRQFRHGGDGAGADVEEACGFFSGGFKMQICILVTTPSTAMR